MSKINLYCVEYKIKKSEDDKFGNTVIRHYQAGKKKYVVKFMKKLSRHYKDFFMELKFRVTKVNLDRVTVVK